jgi:periplasmic iron binding protein
MSEQQDRMIRILTASAALALLAFGSAQAAQEFYVGEPVVQSGMQIVPNYLTGIEMDRHPDGMAMGKDAVHIEADVHATKNETHGFAEDAWIPYLTIRYTLTKPGTNFKATGRLWPMTAKDGPHYANNVMMAGPGTYKLTYVIEPPSRNGFIRHTDAASGVPDWWKPVTASWNFVYPSKTK